MRNVCEFTIIYVLEVGTNVVEDVKVIKESTSSIVEHMEGIKESTNNMVEDMKGIKENTNYLRGFVADELTEHLSDISKKIDEIFPHIEESKVQATKGNLVNPGEPGLVEFYLVYFCFIFMVYASSLQHS